MFNKYFPNGCDCGGEVEFLSDIFMYECTSCGNFVFAHRKESDHNQLYEPLGYLADSKTNLLRHEVKTMFNELWMTKINGKSVINVIYPEYVVCLDEDDGVYGVSVPTKEPYLIRSLKTGEFSVLKSVTPVQNRTKAFVYLSQKLVLPMSQVAIDRLKYEDLLRARKLLINLKNEYKF